MGPQIHGAARGKLTLPKLINDPVCHNAAFSKGTFLKLFLENIAANFCQMSALLPIAAVELVEFDQKARLRSAQLIVEPIHKARALIRSQ